MPAKPAAEAAEKPEKRRAKKLTDKALDKLARRPAKAGKRYDVMDALVPGFGVRVSDRAHLTFILAGRFPGSKHYTRREIGEVGALKLAAARAKARWWIELTQEGKDPKVEEERAKRDEFRKQAHTFESVAEAFINEWIVGPEPEKPRQRKHKVVTRNIRNHFITAWGKRPIISIERGDVLAIIKAKARTAPAEARNLLTLAKSLFGWALDQDYGLDRSVCADIKPAKVIGDKASRDRALTDDEVRALWNCAEVMPYPTGPIYKLLLLTGLRLNEVARAHWTEFALAKRTWTIPAERMKGKNSGRKQARPHLVPVTPQIIEILNGLPTFEHGDFLFSTQHGRGKNRALGEKPVSIGSKAKQNLDKAMLGQLRQFASERGDDPRKVKLQHWQNHDIRRTVRTNLAALKIVEEVREAILAHVQPGIKGTYNVYGYADEKRAALEAWAARLREIVTPPPDEPVEDEHKVVRLRA